MSAQHLTTSTAAENADVVRRAYDAFNTVDMPTLIELFDEGAEWHTPGRSHLAGATGNRDGTFARFGRYLDETNGTFRANLERVLMAEDGCVIGMHHNIGERAGKRLDVHCCIALELRNGRIISGREYFSDLYAWDGFWS